MGDRRLNHGDWVDITTLFRDPQGNILDDCPPAVFHLRHIERIPIGRSYPEIVQRVKALYAQLAEPLLVIDATGVGAATIDLFRKAELSPYLVTITAGDEVTGSGTGLRVPKRDVISAAQVLLQTDRLKIAKDLPHEDLLIRELTGFRMSHGLRHSDQELSWRERANDDLVLALAIGLWIAER